jgi:hypothetical protein
MLMAKATELSRLRRPKGYIANPAAVFTAWARRIAAGQDGQPPTAREPIGQSPQPPNQKRPATSD